MIQRCDTPIAEQQLIDYWVEGTDTERIEEHVLECEACAARLDALAPLLHALRVLASRAPPPVLRREDLVALRVRGVKVNEHRVTSEGDPPPPFDDSDVYVMTFPVDLTGVERLNIDYCSPDGQVFTVLPDAPFQPDDTEVLIACDRHVATAHEAIRFRIRGSVGDAERVLADYCFRAAR